MIGIAALVAADRSGWLLVPAGGDVERYHGVEARVARVLAGDHLEVERADARGRRPTTRVRVWGMRCPRAVRDVAAARAATLVDRAPVTLWIEPDRPREPRGDVLAHVDLATGASLAETLLAEGLAVVDDRLPHARLAAHAHAERRGRQSRRGVWADQERPEATGSTALPSPPLTIGQ